MGDLGHSIEPHEYQHTRASLPSPNPTKSFWQTSHTTRVAHHRSTVDVPRKATVAVIGSGISGVFAARKLLSSSISSLTGSSSEEVAVLVLEARTTCSGATGRNGGHLQPLVHDQGAGIIDFELRNFNYIQDLIVKNGIPCDFRRLKGCVAFWNKVYFEEAKEALRQTCKSTPEYQDLVRIVEDPEELHGALGLREGVVGALVQAMAASLSPYKLVTWLWEDMLMNSRSDNRLNLQTSTPVEKIGKSGNDKPYLLHTPRGIVEADHVIVATNGYTSHLIESFSGLITPAQAQMSALRPPPAFSDRLLRQSYGFLGVGSQDRVMSDYLVQNPVDSGGHLMFGGGRAEIPGHGVGVSDDSFVEPAAEEYLRHLPRLLSFGSKASKDIGPEELLNIDGSWTGIMGYSKDHFPWVGGVPGSEGIWICGGYTGHGMTNAALCGQHAAQLVLSCLGRQDWKEVEKNAVEKGDIPAEYILTKSRMHS